MEFSRQEDWSGLPYPSPGDLPDPGIEPASAALAGGFFTPSLQGSPQTKELHVNTALVLVYLFFTEVMYISNSETVYSETE